MYGLMFGVFKALQVLLFHLASD